MLFPLPRHKRLLLLLCLTVPVIFFLRRHNTATKGNHTFRGETMGTTFSIILANTPLTPGTFEGYKRDINRILEEINAAMSNYRDDSEISRFNNSRDTGSAQKISGDFYTVLVAALEVYRESDGYFDITVSPLVHLWGFGPKAARDPPSDSEIRAALEKTGSDKLVLGEDHTVKKTHEDLQINVNAIAKGFGVDKVAGYLMEKGSRNFMVEIGGEVVTRGRNRQGKRWRIGIDTPDAGLTPGENIHAVVELNGRGMATSGDYRRYKEQGNKRWSHIIDTRTGRPVSHTLASVTVIADTCMMADAYATTLYVMGNKKGMEWVKDKKGVDAYFISRNSDKSFSTKASKGFQLLH